MSLWCQQSTYRTCNAGIPLQLRIATWAGGEVVSHLICNQKFWFRLPAGPSYDLIFIEVLMMNNFGDVVAKLKPPPWAWEFLVQVRASS